jgi:ferrochelatase
VHPRFVAALADGVAAARAGSRADAPVVFTAHSIPAASAATLAVRARARRDRGGASRRRSPCPAGSSRIRAGAANPRDPWLEPDVNDALRALAADGAREVVVAPIGFVCDHVEVLYDLDVEARRTAAALGLRFARASTVNSHPAFIEALADVVRSAAA